MRELIDLVSVYLALAVGFGALWYGIYSGGEVEASIIRAMLCGLGALALGLVAKAVWAVAALLGGARGKRGGAAEGKALTNEGLEGEWEPPGDLEGGG